MYRETLAELSPQIYTDETQISETEILFICVDLCSSVANQISIVPSNTNSAGPVRVTLLNPLSILSKPTSSSLPPRTSTLIGPLTFSRREKINALATTPVPQASVSS